MKTPMARAGLAALAVTLSALVLTPQASAQLDKLLKGAAIVVVIDRFGGEINKAINKLTGTSSQEAGSKTKVVPILSVGQGAYAGAAQISGPSAAVNRVQAVAQVEGTVQFGASLRLKGLIPVTNRKVTNVTGLQRVYGVGITGLIDAKL
jgi:hypothetical protein